MSTYSYAHPSAGKGCSAKPDSERVVGAGHSNDHRVGELVSPHNGHELLGRVGRRDDGIGRAVDRNDFSLVSCDVQSASLHGIIVPPASRLRPGFFTLG